jgi:hypothetical protein
MKSMKAARGEGWKIGIVKHIDMVSLRRRAAAKSGRQESGTRFLAVAANDARNLVEPFGG